MVPRAPGSGRRDSLVRSVLAAPAAAGRGPPLARSARSWASCRCPATSGRDAAPAAPWPGPAPTSAPRSPAAAMAARTASGMVMPGTSLCRNSAWRRGVQRQHAQQHRSRQPVAPATRGALHEPVPLLAGVDGLGHDQVGAGVELARQPLDLVVQVGRGGVERAGDGEARPARRWACPPGPRPG